MLELLPNNLPAIQSHLHGLGWIERDTELANPRPAGEGNMNRTMRVDCVSTDEAQQPIHSSLVLKQAVPFVAKYPDIPAPIERGAAEAAFYRATAAHPALAKRLPRLLGADPENHLLVFQDLGSATDLSAAYHTPNVAAQLPQLMPTLLQWLSQLHAIQPPDKLANLCMRELNHTHIFDLPLQPNNGLELGELTPLAQNLTNEAPLTAAAAELGKVYVGVRSHNSAPALLHGDFYPGSWLAELTRTPAVVNVIDPEFAFVGPAEFDVGVCLAHLQFAGLTRQQATQCLTSYTPSEKFDISLAEGFAGMELIRRLLGVAQLPLPEHTSIATKTRWLEEARTMVLASPI